MTTVKITQLPAIAGANADASDVLPLVDVSLNTTNKITREEFFKNAPDISVSGNISVTGTVDGRDLATDGLKLDGIEAGADVTDTTNVTAAGALMDSELTDITAVKALDQGVATTDSPSFVGVSLSGDLTVADKIIHSGDTNTAIRFPANDTITMETGGVERFKITSDGLVAMGSIPVATPNLGLEVPIPSTADMRAIGVTSPTYLTDFKAAFIRYRGSAATGTTYGLSNADLGALQFLNVTAGAIGVNTASPLVFATTNTERMRITSVGDVGIGTSSPTAKLDVNGDVTIAGAINGIPLRQGILDPENRIINGAFDFWQRGTSSSGGGYVAADRWANGFVGGTVTQSRQSFTLGDTLGSNGPTFFLRQTVSGQSLASHAANTGQNIEGVRSYAGQTITILGWARRSSGSGNMAVGLDQNFGTGGSPSASVSVAGKTVTLTGSWSAFAVTFDVPSIAGKTLGSNGNDSLSVVFWTSAGSNFNSRTNSLGLQTIGVDLWGIHIKLGTHTTAATALYKQPELGPELVKCLRYCEVREWISTTDGNNANYQNIGGWFVRKRASPSVSSTQGTYAAVGVDGFRQTGNVSFTGTTITGDAEL